MVECFQSLYLPDIVAGLESRVTQVSVPPDEGSPHSLMGGDPSSPRVQRVQKSQPPHPNVVIPHLSSLTKPDGKQFPSLLECSGKVTSKNGYPTQSLGDGGSLMREVGDPSGMQNTVSGTTASAALRNEQTDRK